MKLPRTAPLVLGILESDDHNLSFGQQQIKNLHTIYIYGNICMIAMRGSKLTTSYHDIGSRIKHWRTEINDRNHQPFEYDFLHGPTPHLLVHFQIQSFVLLKFEEPSFGAPRTKKRQVQVRRALWPGSTRTVTSVRSISLFHAANKLCQVASYKVNSDKDFSKLINLAIFIMISLDATYQKLKQGDITLNIRTAFGIAIVRAEMLSCSGYSVKFGNPMDGQLETSKTPASTGNRH